MYAILDIIKKVYKPRTCRFPITKEGIEQGKYKPCLEYHLHNCGAPCINKQSYEDYQEAIKQAREVLKGNTREVQKLLKQEMEKYAEELRFEEAELCKQRYLALDNFAAKSEIVSHTITDVDVFTIVSDDTRKNAFINYIHVTNGAELSEMNAKQYKFDRLKQTEKLNPEQKQTRLMRELQDKLKLSKLPYHIECFDNSNISGSDAVAGCIVYKGMKPSKKDYRKYNIKTIVGPDDYASMQEVVRRRYSRMQKEGTPLPDLIITDGGKGQMEVVREVVEDELHLNIPIAGLAKDDRHRTNELLFGFPQQTIALDIKGELFKVLTQIQDEVHRFAISFHRDKRSKTQLHSELDDIKGIGPKTKDALLKSLKTVKRIKEADLQELTEILGASKASIVYNYFHADK